MTNTNINEELLSLYYPDVFLPIFNDQDHFLTKLLSSGLETENTGLDLYLEYNFKLFKVKKKLEEISNRTFENFEFARLLYHTFPKDPEIVSSESTTGVVQEHANGWHNGHAYS